MKPYPIRFRPIFKQTLWGGRRLADRLGKAIGTESDYAESWEVVDHGTDQSVVENGELAGRTLAQLLDERPEWLLGRDAPGTDDPPGPADPGRFPLLLKYLDCHRVLSVQVHPDDRYGLQMPTPDLGKTEAWYIVAVEPGSLVYAGLKEGVDRGQLHDAVQAGNVDDVLHAFVPEPGDCIFIPAGTVHALGEGLLVAEIQQSSDTTFRLFDWNRVGADGNPRQLHVDQALEVTDYRSGPVLPRRSDRAVVGWQRLVVCDKFVLESLESGSDRVGGDQKFHVVTVPRGRATLRQGGTSTTLRTGQSALIPAASDEWEIGVERGAAALAMRLPD